MVLSHGMLVITGSRRCLSLLNQKSYTWEILDKNRGGIKVRWNPVSSDGNCFLQATVVASHQGQEQCFSGSRENARTFQVNGQDLSGASHQVAAEAFKNADEPITVVLRRNSNTGCDKTGNTPQRENTDETHSPNFIAPEPTVAGSDLCFCRFLINNCRSMPAPLSALIMK